jgi:hypothetical protein
MAFKMKQGSKTTSDSTFRTEAQPYMNRSPLNYGAAVAAGYQAAVDRNKKDKSNYDSQANGGEDKKYDFAKMGRDANLPQSIGASPTTDVTGYIKDDNSNFKNNKITSDKKEVENKPMTPREKLDAANNRSGNKKKDYLSDDQKLFNAVVRPTSPKAEARVDARLEKRGAKQEAYIKKKNPNISDEDAKKKVSNWKEKRKEARGFTKE